ncbi:MAG: ABC transporter substrate-binding protein [Betaproteobacteria bacterium]|nr:ABC transporter substrate-binding protein [Betaproteobacteria bacterium]
MNGLAAAAIFFGAAACLAQTQDWQKVWAATFAAAKKEGVVVCGCPVHPGSRAYLISQWAKDYPEIKLQYTGALSPEWPARVEVERSAGQFLWDNMFTGPGAETYRLARISAFDRLVPHLILPDVADPKTWGGWDSAFYDAGKERMLAMWMDISMPHYNARVVAPEKVAAMGLRAILEPEYKGRIVMWDPRVSGGGELQSTHFYMRLGEDAHRKLLVDQQPVFLRDSRAMAERMVRGTAVFSLGPTLDEPLEDFRKAGVTMDIRPMGNAKEVAYGSAGYGIATIMDRPPHPNAARVFVNWLLSKNIQEGLGRAAARQSRRRDVPAIHAPPAGAKPGEDYIELQREVMEAQRQKIMAISRQLRPN